MRPGHGGSLNGDDITEIDIGDRPKERSSRRDISERGIVYTYETFSEVSLKGGRGRLERGNTIRNTLENEHWTYRYQM